MRLLLISDIHGKLEIIDDLASHARADAVIHAGDFGFYDDGSPSVPGELSPQFEWGIGEVILFFIQAIPQGMGRVQPIWVEFEGREFEGI